MIAEAFMIYKYRELYKKESVETNYFDISTTNIPFYDDIIKMPDYFAKNKNIGVKLVYMTKDEYFDIISKWYNIPVEYNMKYIQQNNLDKIKENMISGTKYATPILDYRDKSQEGRHRMIAAYELGQKSIPVYVIRYIS